MTSRALFNRSLLAPLTLRAALSAHAATTSPPPASLTASVPAHHRRPLLTATHPAPPSPHQLASTPTLRGTCGPVGPAAAPASTGARPTPPSRSPGRCCGSTLGARRKCEKTRWELGRMGPLLGHASPTHSRRVILPVLSSQPVFTRPLLGSAGACRPATSALPSRPASTICSGAPKTHPCALASALETVATPFPGAREG